MLTSKRPRTATYADIEALPEHVVGEIIAGELVVSPRPAPRHAVVASRLGGVLGGPFDWGVDGPGGWWILDEPELHVGGDVLVPDLAGWRVERMPEIPEAAYFTLAPDWVCEVLSPSTERHDRLGKLDIYARESVPWVWLVNPTLELLEVLRLDPQHRWVLHASHGKEDEAVHIPPFDAVPIALSQLWARRAPTGR